MKTECNGKIALITGASSGIGEAMARRLADEGLHVLLVARRQEMLQKITRQIQAAGGKAEFYEADLSDETERLLLYHQVISDHGLVDVLINNAGLGWYGYGAEMPWKVATEMLQVNITAAVHFTLLTLQEMRERNQGHIINIGSIVGSLPSQGAALYGATKSFLDHFTTALYRELSGTQVHISVVRAGPVQTEFCQTAAARQGGLHLPTERMGVSSKIVAERVWKLLLRPRRVIYVPNHLFLTPWLETYFGWLIDRLGPLLLKRA